MTAPRWLRYDFPAITPIGAAFFYIGAPLLVGALLGWNRMLVGPHLSRGVSTLYWIGLVALVWIAALVGTRLVRRGVRRWQWPLWISAVVGAVLGILIFYWPIARYRYFGLTLLPEEFLALAPPLPWPTLDYLPRLFANTLPGIIYWLIVVIIMDKLFGAARIVQPDSPSASAEATLRARLPASLDGEILALKAEDHYLRVYTERGDTLVHHRFSDAVHDLRHLDGLQVHRSYWVRRSAIERRFTAHHRQFVRLRTGLQVPVSRSYARLLQPAARLTIGPPENTNAR
ncbi:MAG: DNA-binding protein [Pseudomonadales bacterium]|nr:DNA-binding protein [Pseudomonadales bacterium]